MDRSQSTSTMGSVKNSTQNLSTTSSNCLLDCSVTLEKLNMDELNKLNTNLESNEKLQSPVESPGVVSQINTSHSEKMVINMDVDTIETAAPTNEIVTNPEQSEIDFSYLADIELDQQFYDEQNQFYIENQRLNETHPPLLQNFEANAYNAYNFNQNQLMSIAEAQPEYRVKEEKLDSVPTPCKIENMIYEVLDSDEEEAMKSRNSGNDSTDTIIDLDTHVPTMSVLMIKK